MEDKQTNLKLVGTTPMFVQDAMSTLENAMKYADMIIKAKLCPHHFYERKKENNRWVPDFTKGKPEAILQVIQHGSEVGLTISQSLQQIVPVNGLMSIKGDGAKSLIFASGKLKEGTWKEEMQGSISEGNLRVKITATRVDNGITKYAEFSVEQAKRAGLWVTEQMTKDPQYGAAKRASSWWKYPDRMVWYRALGFLARDLFPDVMAGMVTVEEAADYPQDTTVSIETPSGQVALPDPQHSKERSQDLTDKAVEKVDKGQTDEITPAEDTQEPATDATIVPQEQFDLISKLNSFTEDTYLKLGPQIYKIAERLGIKKEIDAMPGRTSNKKFRLAIIKWLSELGPTEVEKIEPVVEESGDQEPESGTTTDQGATMEIVQDPETEEFEKQMGGGPQEPKESPPNKYGIVVEDLEPSGIRDFKFKKQLYHDMSADKVGITDPRYKEICELHELVTEDGEPFINAYPTKEKFCELATIVEVNQLLELN